MTGDDTFSARDHLAPGRYSCTRWPANLHMYMHHERSCAAELPGINTVYEAHTVREAWRAGDLLVVDNLRTATPRHLHRSPRNRGRNVQLAPIRAERAAERPTPLSSPRRPLRDVRVSPPRPRRQVN
jgi:hypothetical protein